MLTPVMDPEEVRVRDVQLRELFGTLISGEDYDPGGEGGLFGSTGPSLLQPGAEKLAAIYGLSLVPRVTHRVEDYSGAMTGEPTVTYEVTTDVLLGDILVCAGLGLCTSQEPGFRWRWVDATDVPEHLATEGLLTRASKVTEFDFAIEKGETTGQYGKPPEYWEAFRRAIHSGTAERGSRKSKKGSDLATWSIESVSVRIPNPDMAALANSILKRAKKRSLMAGVITAIGGLSAIVTQDTEDEAAYERRQAERPRPPRQAPPAASPEFREEELPKEAFHSTPLIDAMRDPKELLGADGLMARIAQGCKENHFHRSGAWTKAIVAGAGLVQNAEQWGVVERAAEKVKGHLGHEQSAEVQAALKGSWDKLEAAAA